MTSKLWLPHRREIIQGFAIGSGALLMPALFHRPGLYADELQLTPKMTEGPFFPDRLPLDTDNDLLIINDAITPAVGEITHLSGKILGKSGVPLGNALVEIWQVDNHGSYLHSRGGNSNNNNKRDSNFQGYGRFLTNRQGEYYFRTIKPVTYPGRTPHIHFRVSIGDKKILATQMLMKDHPMNANDGLFRSIRNEDQRKLLMAEFKPIEPTKHSQVGQFSAEFNLIVGHTPEDG